MLIGDPLLVVVNGTGAALNTYYLLTCYTYTKVPVRACMLAIIAGSLPVSLCPVLSFS